jgi:hypothetical protein
VPDAVRLEHLVLLLMLVHTVRLWWRLNWRKVKGWLQRVKDHLPIHRHPKSPKDCPHCCRGVHLEKVHINCEVQPWSAVKSRLGGRNAIRRRGVRALYIVKFSGTKAEQK